MPDKIDSQRDDEASGDGGTFKRRDILKGLATLPVLGVFGVELFRKFSFDRSKKRDLLSELFDTQKAPAVLPKTTFKKAGELVRLGLIGFGSRGQAMARAAGFAHPEWLERQRERNQLAGWLKQDDLNVVITGFCEVFDLRADRTLAATTNGVRPSGAAGQEAPKRFRSYRDMVTSPDIDAILIATPDHHHAAMTLAAVSEGKHVYCEKCMTRTEDQVFEVERAVKAAEQNKGVVFQLGHQNGQNSIYHKAKEILDKEILGKVTLVETNTNRNTPDGAWVRHLDDEGKPKPGSAQTIDWQEWLGSAPRVPFSIERYYNWTKYWDYATGLSGQLFSHDFDAMNRLLGLGIPKACVASGGNYFYKDGRDIPDVFQATFEFPDRDLTLLYSATLANSKRRGRILMGHDASMEIGDSLKVFVDKDSTRYREKIQQGRINPDLPMFSYQPGAGKIDAITSASQQYYASRGLLYTYRNGRRLDVAHLHLSEWLNAIRNRGPLSCGIDTAVEVTIACHMATRSYRERRRVEWDSQKRRIVTT